MKAEKIPKGFTLIELMVAISIVAILATIGMVMYSSAQGTARDAKRKGDLEDIKKALYLHQAATGSLCPGYTTSICSWGDPPVGVNDSTWGFGGSDNTYSLRVTLAKYLKNGKVYDAKNPTGATGYATDYRLAVRNETFTLYAVLENPPPTPVGCTLITGYNYCISN